MRLAIGGTLLAAVLVAPAAAQESVRLRNGRFLAGTVQIDEADKEGFKLVRWDTGAVVFVKWGQIPDAERNRLLGRSVDAVSGPAVPMIEGIRVVTTSREEIGVLVREDANQILIKTRNGKSPVVIPKNQSLVRRDHPVKIKESDAYSSEEMVDARVAKAAETDYAAMLEVARFAAGLGLFERAKGLYEKAASAPNAKKDEIAEIIARNDGLIREAKAGAVLEEVRRLVDDAEYPKALELARKLLAEHAETEVAKQNAGLVASIERESKDWEVKKADILAQKVPELYKAKRSALISAAASSKYKIAEARALVAKVDDEVAKALGTQFKSSPDEIYSAWGKREMKQRTVSFGEGSWIVKGGQDGGLDTDAKGTPKAPAQNQGGNMGGFGNQGGNRGGNRPPAQPKPVDLGKKLESSAEWWAAASNTDRKHFLEAEYAKNSSQVKKEIKSKKCSLCQGEGTFKGVRLGFEAEWKCGRCHGAKEDEIIVYW